MASPKLRFKAFDGDWSKKRLDSFLDRVSNPVDVIGDQEYVQIGIRSHGKGIFHKEAVTGKELGNKRVFWIVPNALVVNIVFAWERAIAVTSENEKGLIASHRFPMYLPKNNLSNVDFLRYMFLTDKGQSYLELASPGGAGRNKTLGQSNFAELKIDLPDVKEQTQIASFLSAVDEKISELTKKHELLSQYKQGMMQKLFSQQIRFKADDGSEFREWTVSDLGKTTEYFKGFAFKSESYKEDGIRIIRVSDLDKDSIKYQNEAIFLDKNEAQNYLNWEVKKKDIIVTTVGSKPHLIDSAVGRPIFVKNDSEGLLNQNLLVLRPKNENIDAYFIFSQLLDKKYLTHIETIQRGNANQSNITVKDLQDFELSIPCLEEQTKIANFLSAIDQKLEKVAQQIEETKQWKKGLLQQMFV